MLLLPPPLPSEDAELEAVSRRLRRPLSASRQSTAIHSRALPLHPLSLLDGSCETKVASCPCSFLCPFFQNDRKPELPSSSVDCCPVTPSSLVAAMMSTTWCVLSVQPLCGRRVFNYTQDKAATNADQDGITFQAKQATGARVPLNPPTHNGTNRCFYPPAARERSVLPLPLSLVHGLNVRTHCRPSPAEEAGR